MREPAVGAVEVAPLLASGVLRGFVICGRWPDSTREWASFLLLAVQVAGTPGMLTTTTVFGAREELPEDPRPGMVGLVMSEGPVLGEGAVAPGRFADRQPPALLLLHPPSETRPSLPECAGVASGCVLLPGLPHLGLEHRAAWVEAEPGGGITGLVSRTGIEPSHDPDTAVLAMLLAA
ncbi:MAG: peptidase [Mycobacteriaceae bacterium]